MTKRDNHAERDDNVVEICPDSGGCPVSSHTLNGVCPRCGGNLIGDGWRSVLHCENADLEMYEFHEPDARAVLCDGFWSEVPEIY